MLRGLAALRAADAACARAGKRDASAARLDSRTLAEAEQLIPAFDVWAKAKRVEAIGPDYNGLVDRLEEAAAAGRTEEALALVSELLQTAAGEEHAGQWAGLLAYAGDYLSLPGGERLIPQLQTAAAKGKQAGRPDTWYPLAVWGTEAARHWSGRDDVWRDLFYWCLGEMDERRDPPPLFMLGNWHRKAVAFGRAPEAGLSARRYLTWQQRPEWREKLSAGCCAEFITAATPTVIRRLLYAWSCRVATQPGARLDQPLDVMAHVPLRAPPADKATWALEAGLALSEVVPRFATVDLQVQALKGAAQLFTEGGHEELAQRALAAANAVAQGDAPSLWALVLAGARAAADEGHWDEVVAKLKPTVTGGPRGPELLEASTLLAEAYRQLGNPAEADAAVEQARLLLGELDLTPAQRVNYLLAAAGLMDDASYRTRLLEEARAVAAQAGLEVLQQGVAERLAQAAIQSGDLPAARAALLDLVQQGEAKRERLAFDPLLRQQWFADSLGPYRKLLWVAAKEGDATLALSCAERMRSRALWEQLAWRKVDLGVRLPKAVQDRLQALREMRRETYALLQQATGAEAGGGERGAYMPIRGLYLPIRGPLDEQPAPPADCQTRLKTMLTSLAQEETALESAIRKPSRRTSERAR